MHPGSQIAASSGSASDALALVLVHLGSLVPTIGGLALLAEQKEVVGSSSVIEQARRVASSAGLATARCWSQYPALSLRQAEGILEPNCAGPKTRPVSLRTCVLPSPSSNIDTA